MGAAQAIEAQTSVRGVRVTRSDYFLSHFDQGEENTKYNFEKVEQLTIDNAI